VNYIKQTVGKVFSGGYRSLAILVVLLGIVTAPLVASGSSSASIPQCTGGPYVCLFENSYMGSGLKATFNAVSRNTCHNMGGMTMDNLTSSLYNNSTFKVRVYSTYNCAGPDACYLEVNANGGYYNNLGGTFWTNADSNPSCFGNANDKISSLLVY
jgi:hypothetical protein